MKYRNIIFGINEIVLDYEGVATAVNTACQRAGEFYRVSGVCQADDCVFFPIEETIHHKEVRYVIAPFTGTSKKDIEADLFSRWSSGFSTKGLIQIPNAYLGLFEIVITGKLNKDSSP